MCFLKTGACLIQVHFNVFSFFGNRLPYFFAYKTEFLFSQNNLNDLDSSCKTDLDLLGCLGRVNLVL